MSGIWCDDSSQHACPAKTHQRLECSPTRLIHQAHGYLSDHARPSDRPADSDEGPVLLTALTTVINRMWRPHSSTATGGSRVSDSGIGRPGLTNSSRGCGGRVKQTRLSKGRLPRRIGHRADSYCVSERWPDRRRGSCTGSLSHPAHPPGNRDRRRPDNPAAIRLLRTAVSGDPWNYLAAGRCGDSCYHHLGQELLNRILIHNRRRQQALAM